MHEARIELDAPRVAPVAASSVTGPVVHEINAYKRARRKSNAVPMVAVIAGLFVAGAGAFAYMRGRATGKLPSLIAPRHAKLTVEGLPPKAEVYVDEAQAFSNPVELTRGQIKHTLRIEAPGYRAKVLTVMSDDDHTIDGRLEREGRKRLPGVP